MTRFMLLTLACLAASAGVVYRFWPAGEQFGGFLSGAGLFLFNCLVLVVFARTLMEGAGEGAPKRSTGRTLAFGGVIGLKLAILGGGVYLALVVFGVSPWFFVAGAGFTLVAATLAAWVTRGRSQYA